MKSSNLKYVTRYLNLKKPNRVYVPGDKITTTWAIKDKIFAFSNDGGRERQRMIGMGIDDLQGFF